MSEEMRDGRSEGIREGTRAGIREGEGRAGSDEGGKRE